MTIILKPDSIITQMADLERRVRIMENTGRVTPDVVKAGWGVNVYKMRVFQTAAQNIPDNSNTAQGLIGYDTVTYDTAGDGGLTAGFSATNHKYLVPLAGYYLVNATLGFSLPAVNNAIPRWQLGVYVNGAVSEWGPTGIFTQPAVGVAYFQSASVTESLHLNLGDVVTIEVANVNGGGVWPVFPGTIYTYWSMHLIST